MNPCGDNAICKNLLGRFDCRCKQEYPYGNPFQACFTAPENLVDCTRSQCKCNTAQSCPAGYSCFDGICTDLCADKTCGSNAICAYGLCSCVQGYSGNPYEGCDSQDCESDFSCSSREICFLEAGNQRNCVDGCSKVHCGPNTVCSTEKHRSFCACLPQFFGDATDLTVGCQPLKKLEHECSSYIDCVAVFDKSSCQMDSDGIRKCVNPCDNLVCTDPNQLCYSDKGKASCKCANGFSLSKGTLAGLLKLFIIVTKLNPPPHLH